MFIIFHYLFVYLSFCWFNIINRFFKECPHPTDKHRKELGRRLGLEPLQIKFWFQNKRTQVKTHNEREENETLRAEAQMLRAENARLRQELGDFTCPHCNGPLTIGEAPFDVNEARMEYARLKAEVYIHTYIYIYIHFPS
nr:homeobox-leucine zipper protein MERISTEM L1-like [Ipomoea batatas]